MRIASLNHRPRSRRGVIIILATFFMVVLFAAAAFTVDVAYMHLTRSELQSATDAAARAATYALGEEQNVPAALAKAKEAAVMNLVAGEPLVLNDNDIEFGRSDGQNDGSYVFTKNGTPTSAVRVVGTRAASSGSGPVSLFLGPLLGRSIFEPETSAVASRLDRDICIVVDRSGSMAWDESGGDWSYPAPGYGYFTPPHDPLSRWAGLVQAVRIFKNSCKETESVELLALVSYAHEYSSNGYSAETVTRHKNLTKRYGQLMNKLNQIDDEPIIGGTNISSGLYEGIDTVTNPSTARPFAYKLIVLMTDGVWNHGVDPIVPAQAATDQAIIVHTITFSSGANQADMRAVAELTGGKHYHAPTRTQLIAAFKEIAYSMPVVLTQ